MIPILARSFSKLRNPNYIDGLTSTTSQKSTLASLICGGVKTYGNRALVAMFNDYKQFHNLGIFGPQDATIMSLQGKHRALRAFNIMKEKRCSKIKGRMCADGIFQRTYIPREEATSPTISLEALFSSLLIDAHEGISLHNFTVPGAYIHTSLPYDQVVHMKSEGRCLDIMCKVNPEYEKFVKYFKGKKGTVCSVLRVGIWNDI